MAIEEDAITLINVFPVEPEKQDELVEILTRTSEQTMKHHPGFLSATVFRGINGTYVANYVQWRSREDFNQMLARPEAQEHLAEVHKITRGNPQLYELCSVVTGKRKAAALVTGGDASLAGWRVLEGGARKVR